MYRLFHDIRKAFPGLIGLVALLALAADTQASWLGYKNDTPAVVVVQTSIVVNGKVIRGKAHALYPGEIAWDNIPTPGLRSISVFDPKAGNRMVATGNVNVTNQDMFLSVQLQPVPPIQGQPQPPVVRLLPGKAPVTPGQPAPKPARPAPNTPVPPRGPLPPIEKPKAGAPKGSAAAPKASPPAETPKGHSPAVPPKSATPPSDAPKGPAKPPESSKSKSG